MTQTFRCPVSVSAFKQPAARGLELSCKPKSRAQYMRLCGRLWDRALEQGQRIERVFLRVDTQDDPTAS